MALLVTVLVLLAGGACGSGEQPQDDHGTILRVLAPASMTEAFGVMAAAFEDANDDVEVEVSFGGSPSLVTQLAAGAPADVLVTADEQSMRRAVAAGDVADPERFARNHLTVVVEPGNPRGVAQVQDLERDDLVVVVCAPEVPCGRLAARVLDSAKVTVAPRSQEENVKAVLSKVALGEADAGLVYETDARAAGDRVDALTILPSDAVLTTAYPVAVVTEAAAPAVARRWIEFVRSSEGQQVLADHGFLPA